MLKIYFGELEADNYIFNPDVYFNNTYEDEWIVDKLYLNKHFRAYFEKFSGVKSEKGFYPTVTLRQIMWALKMKPIKRKVWETAFDHAPI